MTLNQWLANLGAWSAQVAALVVMAAVAAAGLRLTLPRARLALWQGLLALCLALPFVQPWLPAPVTSIAIVGGTDPVGVPSAPTSTSPPVAAQPPERPAFPAGQAVAAVLVLGALARLAWLGLGFARLARLRRAAELLDPLSASIDRAVGLSGADATLALSDGIDGPVTFGLRRPVVLLPKGFLELAPDFQTTVVCHELAHVRRRDWAWTVGETLVTAAFWFHPAVWWLVSEIQVSREAVIDREVVEITGARKPYLEALVYLASDGARPAMAPAVPMLGRRHLARRMRLLLSEVSMSKTRLVVSFATIALTVAVVGRYTVWAFPLTGPAPTPGGVATDRQEAPPTRLQPGERPPSKIHDVRPIYPEAAKQAGIEGIVIAEVTIETDGTVSMAGVVRSVPLLDDAALEAIRQWRFDDVAHRVTMYVTVRFALDGKEAAAQTERPKPPAKIHDVRPEYPEEARQARVEGVVIVQVTIDTDGNVAAAKVLRSVPMLDQAALDAVYQWRFEPPDEESVMTVTVAFRLEDEKDAARTATPPEERAAAALSAAEVRAVNPPFRPPPRLLHQVKPRYPPELLRSGENGTVDVRLVVDATGTVAEVTVLSGPEGFHQAVIDAVKQWRFEPPGTSRTVEAELTFTAKGERREPPPLFGPGSAPAPAGPSVPAVRFRPTGG